MTYIVVVIAAGLFPVFTVPIGDREPSVFILYSETVLSFEFITYTNLSEESTAIEIGKFPVFTAPIGVREPFVFILYSDVVLSFEFITYTNLPEGPTTIEMG